MSWELKTEPKRRVKQTRKRSCRWAAAQRRQASADGWGTGLIQSGAASEDSCPPAQRHACPITGYACFVTRFFQITEEQTNSWELNANRVERRSAEHLSCIGQKSSLLSPEREVLGDASCSFSWRIPTAGWYDISLEYLSEHIRATLRSRRGFNVNHKTAANTNLLHKVSLHGNQGPKRCSIYF